MQTIISMDKFDQHFSAQKHEGGVESGRTSLIQVLKALT